MVQEMLEDRFHYQKSSEVNIVGFIDDNSDLVGSRIDGKEIYSPNIKQIVNKKYSMYFTSIPFNKQSRRNQILKDLNELKLIIKTIPNLDEIIIGKYNISEIRELNLDDLLGREKLEPNRPILEKQINSKTILVTGSGGSIGSELCRQIIKYNPNILILLDISEISLYQINLELENFINFSKNKKIKIITFLVSANNRNRLENIFQKYRPQIVCCCLQTCIISGKQYS